MCSTGVLITRVGQNHVCTVYIRYFWQENHWIYGHTRRIYTVLANPTHNSLHDFCLMLTTCLQGYQHVCNYSSGALSCKFLTTLFANIVWCSQLACKGTNMCASTHLTPCLANFSQHCSLTLFAAHNLLARIPTCVQLLIWRPALQTSHNMPSGVPKHDFSSVSPAAPQAPEHIRTRTAAAAAGAWRRKFQLKIYPSQMILTWNLSESKMALHLMQAYLQENGILFQDRSKQ